MCIDHGRTDIFMSKQILDSPDIITCLQKMDYDIRATVEYAMNLFSQTI